MLRKLSIKKLTPLLLTTKVSDIGKRELLEALARKAEERKTTVYVDNHRKYLADIRESRDLLTLWNAYKAKYPYTEEIEFTDIVDSLTTVFDE